MMIITGNPGTGKHTIAKILADRLGLEIIDINKIAIGKGMFKKSDGTLDVDVRRLKKILDKKVSKDSLVVGHLAPYVVSRNKVDTAVVLRRNPYTLERVYKSRKYSQKKSIENLGSEILGIIHYDTIKKIGRNKTFQFDTTNRSILSIAKKVESAFLRDKIKEDAVDWLGLVLKKGDLRRFFPY